MFSLQSATEKTRKTFLSIFFIFFFLIFLFFFFFFVFLIFSYVRVANDANAVVFLTQATNRNAGLLATKYQIRMVTSHANSNIKKQKFHTITQR